MFLFMWPTAHAQRAVVYFDQHLGAAHSKRWLKYALPTLNCIFRPTFGVPSTQMLVEIFNTGQYYNVLRYEVNNLEKSYR